MFGYRKNVASQGIGFKMLSTTTFLGVAGLTVTVAVSIDGAAAGAGGGSVTSLGGGQYWYAMTQAETNGGMISFFFTALASMPDEKTIVTTAANPTDGVRFGLTALPNAAAAAAGGLPTVGAAIPNATAGAAGGLFIAGANAAATVNFTGNLSGTVGSIAGVTFPSNFATLAIDGSGDVTLTAAANNAIADAYLDRANAIETAITPRLAMRYSAAALAGVLAGAGTNTVTIDGCGVGTTRITATVDADGDRPAVVLS